MRISLDGQLLYDYILTDLEQSSCYLNIPVLDIELRYREFESFEHNPRASQYSSREIAAARRAMTKMLKELSREMLVYCIYNHFLSVPPGMERMYVKMIDELFVPVRGRNGAVADSAQGIGFYTFSDSMAEGTAMIDINNFDRWAMIDVDFVNTTCLLTVGRNLKDHLHEMKYGNGRWRGIQYLPDGNSFDDDGSDIDTIEDALLQTVRGTSPKDEKPTNKQRPSTRGRRTNIRRRR